MRKDLILLVCALMACSESSPRQQAAPHATTDRRPTQGQAGTGAPTAAAPEAPAKVVRDDAPALYDLIANRPVAVVHRQGALVIEAGTPDFLKYVDGGWKSSWIVGQRDGEHRVAAVAGLTATIRFPLDRDPGGPWTGGGDLKAHVTMRPLRHPGRCSVFLNGTRLGDLELPEPGLNSYSVTLPEAHLRAGENAFRLHFRGAADYGRGRRASALVERVVIAPAGATAMPPREPLAASVAVGRERRRALSAQGASRFSYYVEIPGATTLSFRYGSATASAAFAVGVAREGKPAVEVWKGEGKSAWQPVTVDLAPFAKETVRLDLITTGVGAWAAPKLLPAPRVPTKHATAKHVIIWMIDTLRADKLTVYNPGTRVKTPNITRWAKGAVRIEWPMVPGTWSMPSHASLLTGLQPPAHGAVSPSTKLSPKITMVSEQLKSAGFTTAIFSANGYVSDRWGFKQGWDHYRNFIRESKPNGADYVWKTAKPWIEKHKDQRLFVYLATVDPHVVYNPKPEFAKLYFPEPYRGPIVPIKTGHQMHAIKTGKMKLNATDRRYLEALYDAEITQNDHAFGQVLADLEAMGILKETALIVVSDHGDEFFDHGSAGHGHSTHQELVWVPFLFASPGMPGGKVVPVDADIIDVYSTVLDLAGVAVNAEAQGESLVPITLAEGLTMPRATFSWMGEQRYVHKGMKIGRWKLINWGAGRIELYDVRHDPKELKDVAEQRPLAVRLCRNVFGYAQAHEKEWRKARWGAPGVLKPAYADEIGM